MGVSWMEENVGGCVAASSFGSGPPSAVLGSTCGEMSFNGTGLDDGKLGRPWLCMPKLADGVKL